MSDKNARRNTSDKANGPEDEKHLMFYTYASNRMIIILAIYYIVMSILFVWAIFRLWPEPNATGTLKITDLSLTLLVILMGAIGSIIQSVSSFVKYTGARKLLRSWFLYYLFRPIEGSGLALIVYLLFRVGIVGNMGTTAQINIYAILGISGLTGLFSKQAIEKLREVFETLFLKGAQSKKEAEKDSLGEESHKPNPFKEIGRRKKTKEEKKDTSCNDLM